MKSKLNKTIDFDIESENGKLFLNKCIIDKNNIKEYTKDEIKNKTIRSFLYYVPYVTLAVMTFPAILSATGSVWSAWAALIVAAALAWFGKSLLQVSVCACVVVFLLELFL